MTACLYLTPPHDPDKPPGERAIFAVVMADTIATLMRTPEESGPRLPAAPFNLGSLPPIRLVRKLHIFEELAVAFAGDGGAIKKSLHEVRVLLPEWRLEDRPLKRLGEMCDRTKVATVALLVDEKGVHNTSPANQQFETKHLGKCAVIGSGADALMEQCMDSEEYFENWDKTKVNVYDKILGFAQAVNGRRLGEELVGAPGARQSWGGYLEWAVWDHAELRWERGPPTVHLFYVFHVTSEEFSFRRVAPTICYDPTGRLINISQGMTIPYQLEGIEEEVKKDSDGRFWVGWKPRAIVLTFITPLQNGDYYFGSRTLIVDELKDTTCELGNISAVIGINENLRNKLAAEFAIAVPFLKGKRCISPPASENGLY